MTLNEAKKIIGYCLNWQFVNMGIFPKSEMILTDKPDISKYSLEDLIKANKMIASDNKRREKLANYHRSKGHNVKGRKITMTIADRTISAIYTALHFEPNGEMVAIIDDIGVGCVRVEYNPS